MKEYIYKRRINYYETDRMGVVHHSNYIRFLEEARCAWLEDMKIPFSLFEENGITIPVLGVSVEYKNHVTFDDVIEIHVYIKEYNSVRMTVGYNVIDEKTGKVVLTGQTKHCFTNSALRPVNLKKVKEEFDNKFREIC